jgi:tRNA modification GTPase
MTDTIFALSSGHPPAGIAIVRISGPKAGAALTALAGRLPEPRAAALVRFCDPEAGSLLDRGLALWFPAPHSVTGEDLAELHLHGARAVVAAVLLCLSRREGLRAAQAGEFTRRAFENGRIDLAEAEGLADLLAAETETQRQSALAMAEGGLGQKVADWQNTLLHCAALVEADLDFSDESDVEVGHKGHTVELIATLQMDMAALLAEPPAERLRDGVRIVFAGPPNSGKSSLFNSLLGREAAIVTEIAGTTRDRIEASIALDGIPLLVTDTAGLRDEGADPVEQIGIARTGEALAQADIILWMGAAEESPKGALLIASKSDLGETGPGLAVSTLTGEGLPELRRAILEQAKALLPKEGALALNARHRGIVQAVLTELDAAAKAQDMLITAEHLRYARTHLDALTGRAGVEDMLDALFGTFCIGK